MPFKPYVTQRQNIMGLLSMIKRELDCHVGGQPTPERINELIHVKELLAVAMRFLETCNAGQRSNGRQHTNRRS
jgi:hypothetical protein